MGLWATFHQLAALPLKFIGLLSMVGFGVPVALAIRWRKRPAYHRRLLLIGTAVLTNAAFACFPWNLPARKLVLRGTDLLICIIHDLWKDLNLQIVYRNAMPSLLAAQIAVLMPARHYLRQSQI